MSLASSSSSEGVAAVGRTSGSLSDCLHAGGGQSLRQQRQQTVAYAHLGGAGALGPAVNGQLLRVVAASGIGGAGREEVGGSLPRAVTGAPGDPLYLEFPPRAERDSRPPEDPPLIRVM